MIRYLHGRTLGRPCATLRRRLWQTTRGGGAGAFGPRKKGFVGRRSLPTPLRGAAVEHERAAREFATGLLRRRLWQTTRGGGAGAKGPRKKGFVGRRSLPTPLRGAAVEHERAAREFATGLLRRRLWQTTRGGGAGAKGPRKKGFVGRRSLPTPLRGAAVEHERAAREFATGLLRI